MVTTKFDYTPERDALIKRELPVHLAILWPEISAHWQAGESLLQLLWHRYKEPSLFSLSDLYFNHRMAVRRATLILRAQ